MACIAIASSVACIWMHASCKCRADDWMPPCRAVADGCLSLFGMRPAGLSHCCQGGFSISTHRFSHHGLSAGWKKCRRCRCGESKSALVCLALSDGPRIILYGLACVRYEALGRTCQLHNLCLWRDVLVRCVFVAAHYVGLPFRLSSGLG